MQLGLLGASAALFLMLSTGGCVAAHVALPGAQVFTANFRPYTPKEVGALRKNRLQDVNGAPAALVVQIDRRKVK